jgi:hypothetical protein
LPTDSNDQKNIEETNNGYYPPADNIETVYILDNKQGHKNAFDPSDESLFVLISAKRGEKGEKDKVFYHAFTTEEGFVDFGLENNLKLRELLIFERHMSKYAETSGVEMEFELTGKVPEWYSNYEAEYYSSVFNKSPLNKCFWTELKKDIAGGQTSFMGGTLPFMWPGWNNTVSRFKPLGLYGFTVLYDKWRYKRRIAVFWGWGFSSVFLDHGPPDFSWANNRMSSGFSG